MEFQEAINSLPPWGQALAALVAGAGLLRGGQATHRRWSVRRNGGANAKKTKQAVEGFEARLAPYMERQCATLDALSNGQQQGTEILRTVGKQLERLDTHIEKLGDAQTQTAIVLARLDGKLDG